jgi:hypothetical protein
MMRNVLALLALLFLAFTGTGLCRGWYSVSSLPSEPGRSAFRVEINRTQVADDVSNLARSIVRALKRDQEEKTHEAESK